MKKETFYQVCGELSTKNFSVEHPEVAKEWLVKALEELGFLEYLSFHNLMEGVEETASNARDAYGGYREDK